MEGLRQHPVKTCKTGLKKVASKSCQIEKAGGNFLLLLQYPAVGNRMFNFCHCCISVLSFLKRTFSFVMYRNFVDYGNSSKFGNLTNT